MQKAVEAPEWEWGTKEQCAAYLGIDTDQFRLLMRTGKFPFPPVSYGRKTVRWHWMDVVAYGHMRQRNVQLGTEKDGEDLHPEK